VASTKNRQRAQARAKLERQMARRAAQARRRRQIQAIIGIVLAVVVVVGGATWIIWSNIDHSKKKSKASASTTPTPGACSFTKAAAGNTNLKDVGTPSTSVARSGTQALTLATTQGEIDIQLDVTHAPCNSASFAYLAGKKFFDNSACHRLASNPPMLQCGDPTGSGSGGPTYTVNDENLPTGKNPTYPKGTVAVANTGSANTGSSQFFIMYKDSSLAASYTVLGKVTKGLDVVQKVANGGDDGAYQSSAGGGHPKIAITIKTARAGTVVPGTPTPTPTATATASATPSTKPSSTASAAG
jgi:peptidyl-prolyl cis-trans isomerase B (cyclophilin B)